MGVAVIAADLVFDAGSNAVFGGLIFPPADKYGMAACSRSRALEDAYRNAAELGDDASRGPHRGEARASRRWSGPKPMDRSSGRISSRSRLTSSAVAFDDHQRVRSTSRSSRAPWRSRSSFGAAAPKWIDAPRTLALRAREERRAACTINSAAAFIGTPRRALARAAFREDALRNALRMRPRRRHVALDGGHRFARIRARYRAYVAREMTRDQAIFATQDADSEGFEGISSCGPYEARAALAGDDDRAKTRLALLHCGSTA